MSQLCEPRQVHAEHLMATAARRRVVDRSIPIVGCLIIAVSAVLVAAEIRSSIRAERRAHCVNNLKALGLAFQEYEKAHGHLPAAAITGKDGKPLLSWRVELLPYLGHRNLYLRFHRDEPWDSPHNLALLSQMPDWYKCPSEPHTAPGLTTYHVVIGPKPGIGMVGTMFEDDRGIDAREILDGMSNTVMAVETVVPVPWTMPGGLRFALDGPLPTFGSRHRGGYNALMGDGSVKLLKFSLSTEILRMLLTRDGGEVTGA